MYATSFGVSYTIDMFSFNGFKDKSSTGFKDMSFNGFKDKSSTGFDDMSSTRFDDKSPTGFIDKSPTRFKDKSCIISPETSIIFPLPSTRGFFL